MKLDIRHIEVFQEVMQRGSVTEAARALGVTQPAVSASIARLEKEIGFSLFQREGRHLAATPEARLFSAEAMRAMSGFEGLADIAAGISAATRGQLTIATNPAPAISWLPAMAAEFQRDRPGVKLRFISRSSKDVRELAPLDGFDIGLAEAPFLRQDVVAKRFRLRMVAALHKDHPLSTHEALTPRLVHEHDFIAVNGALWTDAAIARAFEADGVGPRVTAECEYIATALGLVAQGAGLCLADPISAANFAHAGVVTRPFEPAIHYEIGLMRPARGHFSRLAAAFAEAIEERLAPFES